MVTIIRLAILTIIISCGAQAFRAQCEPPKIVFNNNSENIFTEEQEMMLGEVILEQIKDEFTIIEDKALNAPLRRIAARIEKHLPETGIRFRYHLVEMPDTNAFITAGGNVFITRKLVSFVQSEDELAGIIAHELGHGIVRHSAIDISTAFRKILKINDVGDRTDIYNKFNQLIDNRRRKRISSRGHEGDQQMEADEIGLFAMTAAGYEPEAFSSAYDRLTESEGKTGGWFSDLLGRTTPAQKRLREMVNRIKSLPQECLDRSATTADSEFENWQTEVLLYKPSAKKFNSAALKRRVSLTPYLRDDIAHLAFSPDGRLILARDESTVIVIQKEPFKTLFTIDIDNVESSQFTRDSKSIQLLTADLRYEKWDVASRKPVLVRELYIRGGCTETELSPSGQQLACFQGSTGDLRIYDLASKKVILEKEKFLKMSQFQFFFYRGNIEMEFSPSGRYLIASRISQAGIFTRAVRDSYFGYDFSQQKEIEIPNGIKRIVSMPFSFISDDKIIGQHRKDAEKSGIFEFPSGKQIEKFALKGNSLSTPHKGNYLIVRPIKVAPVGVYDLSQKKFLIANQKSALAVYDNSFVSENKDGILGFFRLDKDETLGELSLPKTKLGTLRTVEVSPDLNWIAVSDTNRGGVWSLFDGVRYAYTRSFRGAYFDRSGKVYIDFAKTKETARQFGIFDVTTRTLGGGPEPAGEDYAQHGEYVVNLKFDKDKRRRVRVFDIPAGSRGVIFFGRGAATPRKGTLQMLDLKTQKTLWERRFDHAVPTISVNNVAGTMTMRWPLRSEEVKDLVADDRELRKERSKRKESRNDFYVQIVDVKTGAVKGGVAIETGRGSFGITNVSSYGDWLTVADTQNRILIYSVATGELVQRFFGNNVTVAKETNLAAVGNSAGEISVYDLISGRLIDRLNLGKGIAFAQFGKYGKKLFVLTRDQEGILLDVTKLGSQQIASVDTK